MNIQIWTNGKGDLSVLRAQTRGTIEFLRLFSHLSEFRESGTRRGAAQCSRALARSRGPRDARGCEVGVALVGGPIFQQVAELPEWTLLSTRSGRAGRSGTDATASLVSSTAGQHCYFHLGLTSKASLRGTLMGALHVTHVTAEGEGEGEGEREREATTRRRRRRRAALPLCVGATSEKGS
jgi:hypothetical protein